MLAGMKDQKNALIVEFLGTFALIFFGAGSIIADALTDGAVGITGIALAHGLTIAVVVSAIGHISGGHINPAVTVGFLVARRISLSLAAGYIVVQLLGGITAAYILKAIVPNGLVVASKLGNPTLNPQIGPAEGILMEIILTFFLVFVIFGTAVNPRSPKGVAGFAIGLTVAIAVLVGGPWTGAALNPARALGPAVASLNWDNHLIYWVGPLIGSVMAAMLYNYVLMEDEKVGQ